MCCERNPDERPKVYGYVAINVSSVWLWFRHYIDTVIPASSESINSLELITEAMNLRERERELYVIVQHVNLKEHLQCNHSVTPSAHFKLHKNTTLHITEEIVKDFPHLPKSQIYGRGIRFYHIGIHILVAIWPQTGEKMGFIRKWQINNIYCAVLVAFNFLAYKKRKKEVLLSGKLFVYLYTVCKLCISHNTVHLDLMAHCENKHNNSPWPWSQFEQ